MYETFLTEPILNNFNLHSDDGVFSMMAKASETCKN